MENGTRRPITHVTEVGNQYLLEFDAASPSSDVEVVLQQPRDLPPLRADLEATTKRSVRVRVTDPMGRFVTGLERTDFGIVEKGAPRPITGVTQLDNEYFLEFEAANPSSDVEVVLRQPRDLPPLRAKKLQ